MKRILLVIMAVSILFCLAGCNGDTTDSTTVPVPTTLSPADSNRAALAKLGFEEFMNYLNICAAYGVPVEVDEGDTIADIVAVLRADGSDVAINNIDENARFFDYAAENPDYGNGGGFYLPREDVDWLALYVD